jgi:N-acetylneuraminic acid mutarotase
MTPQPPLTLFQNDLASSWEFTGLNYTTTYYWKIMVRDNHYAYTPGPVYSFATRECPWFYKREMPSPRYGFGTAVVNDKIYVIGGTDGTNALAEVLEYDPASDTWTRRADMPTPRSQLAVAVWNNRIYALGGRNGYSVSNDNQAYDPPMDSWSWLSPMPVNSSNLLSAQAVKGKIYTFGPVMEYNTATNTWWNIVTYHQDTFWTDTTFTVIDSIVDDSVINYIKSGLPGDRNFHCSAVYNNLIYVMGGMQLGKSYSSPSVDVYHPGTNDWTVAGDMIGPANLPAAMTANGFIYVIGGYDDTYSKRVRKYDPLSDTWFIRSDLQVGRSFLGAAAVGNNIYAIGGINPFILSTVEEYRLDLDPKDQFNFRRKK